MFLLIAFIVTLVLLSRRGSSWVRRAVGGKIVSFITGANVMGLSGLLEINEAKASIRPVGLPLIGGIWVMTVLLMTPIRYASLRLPQGLLFSMASVAFALGYLYWIHRTTKALERLYPYQAPLNLLALRVFGSPHLSDFLDLTNACQWIGTRQRLDGPDTGRT